jgi:hypothetical protein
MNKWSELNYHHHHHHHTKIEPVDPFRDIWLVMLTFLVLYSSRWQAWCLCTISTQSWFVCWSQSHLAAKQERHGSETWPLNFAYETIIIVTKQSPILGIALPSTFSVGFVKALAVRKVSEYGVGRWRVYCVRWPVSPHHHPSQLPPFVIREP